MIFYTLDVLKSAYNNKGFYEFRSTGDKSLGELPTCPNCGFRIGTKQWLPPYNIKITGKYIADLCANGIGSEFLVSKRFADSWKKSNLSGLNFINSPINIKNVKKFKKGELPEYLLVRPEITLTRLDEKESGLFISKLAGCDVCRVASRESIERLRIDESTWEGQDIFLPSGLSGEFVVTEKFVEFVEKNEFTNFVFIHQDDYHYEQDS
ncbi:imm11 family protein [Acidobacteriota bacterium]